MTYPEQTNATAIIFCILQMRTSQFRYAMSMLTFTYIGCCAQSPDKSMRTRHQLGIGSAGKPRQLAATLTKPPVFSPERFEIRAYKLGNQYIHNLPWHPPEPPTSAPVAPAAYDPRPSPKLAGRLRLQRRCNSSRKIRLETSYRDGRDGRRRCKCPSGHGRCLTSRCGR